MGLQPRLQPYLLYPLVRESWVSRTPTTAECANNGALQPFLCLLLSLPEHPGFNLQATNPHTTAIAKFPSHVRNMYITHSTATVIPPTTSHLPMCMVFGLSCSRAPPSRLSCPSAAVMSYTSPSRCAHLSLHTQRSYVSHPTPC